MRGSWLYQLVIFFWASDQGWPLNNHHIHDQDSLSIVTMIVRRKSGGKTYSEKSSWERAILSIIAAIFTGFRFMVFKNIICQLFKVSQKSDQQNAAGATVHPPNHQ